MKIALLAAAAVGALSTSPAVAQTAPPDQPATPASATGPDQADDTLRDIVVTAQRRAERMQDVPIAVSAFSSEQLAARGVTSALDLGQFVPNLTAQNNTGLASANAYFLRGLGSTETIPTFDAPVGTYVDDIYLSRQNANNLSLLDVERVEVLRGPQGTLFGRNTTGGAISVVMRQPEFDRISGYAEAGYGSYNKKLVRGSIDIPLAPTFAIKLSGYWQEDNGYVKNTTTGERLNDDDGWGARLGLRGELGSSVKWTASYTHIVADGEYILNFDCDPRNPSNCDGRFATTGLLQKSATPPLAGVFTGRKSNFPLGNKTDTDLVASKFDIALDKSTTLSLITGYLNQGQRYVLDFFDGRGSPSLAVPTPAVLGLPRGGFTFAADQRSSQFTQEIKLNGSLGNGLIDYVAGAYYLTESVRDDFGDYFGTLGLVLADRILRNSTEAWAGYVQADLNVGKFKFTAGVRYTDEIK
ncbi:MAG: TonB-dependent receptor plug domain-containing protein, partial [Proteobacteria bacterium]|nr:TonB-dependent receptor plug domain-containing protein [Pseudomonadota bacterium]